MGMSGCQALEEWCRLVLGSYPGVSITNMTSSWSDGKAFCALIHAFRPDLVDWETVKTNSPSQNCKLAFETADLRLGITPLLDVCDVARDNRRDARARCAPDRLSILTYVSLFHHKFTHDARVAADSGISSPSPESGDSSRRGGVHSLLSGRRSRSVSASPPIQKENPFRQEFLENISSKAEQSPCKKLVNKFHKQKNNNPVDTAQAPAVRLRHQNTHERRENKTQRQRLVQSMFVEPLEDKTQQHQDSIVDTEETPKRGLRSSRSQGLLGTPKPYRMSPTQQASRQSISILAKTQNYLQDKRKRSQSQPPPDDKGTKRKFDFLSTANFNPRQARKADRAVEKSDNASTLKLSLEKKIAAQHIENSSRTNSKKDERQKLIKTPQFCSFQKFEFALQSHRRFVQTLV